MASAAGMNLIVLWLCGFSVFKDYFSSSHEGSLDDRVTKVLSSFMGPSNFNASKSRNHPLKWWWCLGKGYLPARPVALSWPSPQLAGFICAGLSGDTCALSRLLGFPELLTLDGRFLSVMLLLFCL